MVTEKQIKKLYNIITRSGKLRKQIKNNKEKYIMKKYVCEICGWEYDEKKGMPDKGIAPGTKFEDLPDDFECPYCGVGKDNFAEA